MKNYLLDDISEFWREGEFEIAKGQILDFLERYPDSAFSDQLHAMMGDLHFKDEKYELAAKEYDIIQDPSIQNKTVFNFVQALFELKEYSSAASIAMPVLKEGNGLSKEKAEHLRFLLAESLFRQAMASENSEEKEDLLKKALPHYKLLCHTKHEEACLFPLAESYRFLGQSSQAAVFYEALAEKNSTQKEDLLFQAAALQTQENKEQAIVLFKKVYALKGTKAKEAAFNALVLLYERGEGKDFL